LRSDLVNFSPQILRPIASSRQLQPITKRSCISIRIIAPPLLFWGPLPRLRSLSPRVFFLNCPDSANPALLAPPSPITVARSAGFDDERCAGSALEMMFNWSAVSRAPDDHILEMYFLIPRVTKMRLASLAAPNNHTQRPVAGIRHGAFGQGQRRISTVPAYIPRQ